MFPISGWTSNAWWIASQWQEVPTSQDQKALTFAVLNEMSQQVFVELPWYLVQTLTRHLSLFFNVSYSFFVHVTRKKSCPRAICPCYTKMWMEQAKQPISLIMAARSNTNIFIYSHHLRMSIPRELTLFLREMSPQQQQQLENTSVR